MTREEPKPQEEEEAKQRVSVPLTKEALEKLSQRALIERRSLANMAEVIIEDSLKEETE